MTEGRNGSAELRGLYLDPARAGVPWLLDPANPMVVEGIRAAKRRDHRSECDPRAVAADIDDLLVLLRDRHFGVATGVIQADGLDEWAEGWRSRLRTELPTTWGAAFGADLFGLRQLVGDNHILAMRHEDPEVVAQVDPRSTEPILDDDTDPAYEDRVVDGVLCIRLRRLYGDVADQRAFENWRLAHERQFAYERIIVDLRGCRGGNVQYVYDWAQPHNPEPAQAAPPERSWMLDDRRLEGWNGLIENEVVYGPDNVPQLYRDIQPTPHPRAKLWVDESDGTLPAGRQPWYGRMLVLVDRRTVSAGESSAWALRSMFGAKLVGGPTKGCVSFGHLVPYLLPRSGMAIILPTKQNLYPDVEMTGIPVDVELDPRTPLEAVASAFDQVGEAPIG